MYNDVKKDGCSMECLNKVILELGISKVKLSKFLGVSRQMIYNYLAFESIDEWPVEKRVLMVQLLDIAEFTEKEISNIVITPEYLIGVESRVNDFIRNNEDFENYFNILGLSKTNKTLLIETTNLLREMLKDDRSGRNMQTIKYLYYFLQSIENVPENQYILAYMAKTNCFIDSDEFVFDADRQFILEGILFSALNLYNSGKAGKSKISESRKRFVDEIERKKEEKLGRTQKLKAINAQALKELGYTEMNMVNSSEFIEKFAEIEARKGILNE